MLLSSKQYSNPHSVRCTKSGRKCDGYAQDQAIVQRKTLAPNNILTLRFTSPKVWDSGEDLRYLEFYHRRAVRTLPGAFDSSNFWSHSVLRLAHAESSIRHALIALGYLYKTEPGSMKHARAGLAAEQQSDTLMSHYNKAVRGLVDRMSEVSYTPEIGLVACLLFICIELLRGNYITAFTHLNSGLRMISEASQEPTKSLPYGAQSLNLIPFPLRLYESSGSTAILEDILLPLFCRAMMSALLVGVPVQHIFDIPIPSPQFFQEHTFTSISDAQITSQRLLLPSLYYTRSMAEKLILRQSVTAQNLADQSQLLDCFHSWFRCLQDFENDRVLSKQERIISSSLKAIYHGSYIALATATEVLQGSIDTHLPNFKAINHHAAFVLESMDLSTSLTQDSTSISPSTLPSSPSTTSSATTGTATSPPSPNQSPKDTSSSGANFTFEISLVPTLHHVTVRCRCPETRREALRLLELNPPREGYWDAEVHAAVARRVIELEEREIDPETGWPAKKSRLWCAVPDSNMDRNGGFWVSFAWAWWVQEQREKGAVFSERDRLMRRPDAQWEEWFVL